MAPLDRITDHFGSVGHAELFSNVHSVGFHGFGAEKQLFSDFPRLQSFADKPKYLELPDRKAIFRHCRCLVLAERSDMLQQNPVADRFADIDSVMDDSVDGVDNPAYRFLFHQIPSGACTQCPLASTCDWAPGQRITRTQTYEGTDRQARGAVLAALRDGPADDFSWHDAAQLQRALAGLQADGLIVRDTVWRLPD